LPDCALLHPTLHEVEFGNQMLTQSQCAERGGRAFDEYVISNSSNSGGPILLPPANTNWYRRARSQWANAVM
jgi:hypothetical protein